MVKNRGKNRQAGASPALPTQAWYKRDWFLGALLVLAVFLTYTPVGWAGFIWDDDKLLTANPVIVGPLGLKEIWTSNAADISPLTFTTFWVEYALWGMVPLPYHVFNVLLQSACAIALWRVLRSLQVPGAWLGAALWALHPMQVESVAWVAETKNTQSGLFFLLSILFFLRWLKAQDLAARTGGGWNYAFALLLAAMAMASKSSTVILPVILCLCAWWVEGRWQWRTVARVAPIFLFSIAASALSIWTQTLQLALVADPQGARTYPQRLVMAGDVVWFYLRKQVWPLPVMTVYPRWEIDASQPLSYAPLLAVLILLLVLWLNRESWLRPVFFVFAYFLVAVLPVMGIVDNPIFRYSLVFDHFQFLAGMGPMALAGAGLVKLADFAIPGRFWLRSSLCAGLLLVLAILSWQRAWAYQSMETLWTDTVTKNPSCWVGYNFLGVAYYRSGQVDEAVAADRKALAIVPKDAEAHNNLGAALLLQGKPDEAVTEFQKVIEVNGDSANTQSNIGNAYSQKGRLDEAVGHYQKALAIDPNFVLAHYNLAIAYARQGKLDEAMAQLQEVLRLDPANAAAQNSLAKVQAILRQRAGRN